jgi:CopG-like RHH_1 or ribbon-helix-helix domain, RHH_5
VKSVHLNLPENMYYELERWAQSEARPVSNMAYYLIFRALEKAKAEGIIQPYEEKKKK